jgi:hypothetical protein
VDLTGDIPDFGPTHLVIIQNTAIPYVYPATVGETFSLTASIEGNVENQPGTGGSIELGVPLVELIGLINDVTGGGVGDLFGDILDQAKGNAGDPLRPLTPSGQGTQVTVVSTPILGGLIPAGLCGMLGIESLLMTMMLCVGVGLMTRRRSS